MDGKRVPAYSTDRISALDDISIYTYDEDAPLRDLLTAIFKKEDGKECPSHKDDLKDLTTYLLGLLPNYDQERVYPSDIKKIFQWYNLLHKSGNLKLEEIVEEASAEKKAPKAKKAAAEETEAAPKKKAAAPKKAVATAAKPKAAPSAKSAKPVTAKKTTTTKTSTSRGK
jgi:hypothetical protein